LADHVEVHNAKLDNGLLEVSLVREIPEAMKPRRIPAGSAQPAIGQAPKKVAEPAAA